MTEIWLLSVLSDKICLFESYDKVCWINHNWVTSI